MQSVIMKHMSKTTACILLVMIHALTAYIVENEFIRLTDVINNVVKHRVRCAGQCSEEGSCNGFILQSPDVCELIVDMNPHTVCTTAPDQLCYGQKGLHPETTEGTTAAPTVPMTEVFIVNIHVCNLIKPLLVCTTVFFNSSQTMEKNIN